MSDQQNPGDPSGNGQPGNDGFFEIFPPASPPVIPSASAPTPVQNTAPGGYQPQQWYPDPNVYSVPTAEQQWRAKYEAERRKSGWLWAGTAAASLVAVGAMTWGVAATLTAGPGSGVGQVAGQGGSGLSAPGGSSGGSGGSGGYGGSGDYGLTGPQFGGGQVPGSGSGQVPGGSMDQFSQGGGAGTGTSPWGQSGPGTRSGAS